MVAGRKAIYKVDMQPKWNCEVAEKRKVRTEAKKFLETNKLKGVKEPFWKN